MVGMGSRALPGEISSVKVGEKSAARVIWGECIEPQQFTAVAFSLGLHPRRVKQAGPIPGPGFRTLTPTDDNDDN
jgi:hypothetical protein